MARLRWQYILLFLCFLSAALAASPTTFCKCTCRSNSTIIALDDASTDASPDPSTKRRTCNDCNKQFCLDYHLPICSGVKEEDIFTTCFQRDSRKDEAVVFIFIIATGSLLVWAGVRPWWEKWRDRAAAGHTYVPVAGATGDGEQT